MHTYTHTRAFSLEKQLFEELGAQSMAAMLVSGISVQVPLYGLN